MSCAPQIPANKHAVTSKYWTRRITPLLSEASANGGHYASHPRAGRRQARSGFRSRHRALRRHDDCRGLDDRLRYFHCGRWDLTPDRLSGWIAAHLDYHGLAHGVGGAFLRRTGCAFSSRRRTICIFARSLLPAVGISVRLDAVPGNSDGHYRRGCRRLRALPRRAVPLDFAHGLDRSANGAFLEVRDKPVRAATRRDIDDCFSHVPEYAGGTPRQDHSKHFYQCQDALAARADLRMRFYWPQCSSYFR